MTTPEIIDFLNREQTRLKITDVQLCKDIGISKTTLWRIKNGLVPVTNNQVLQIANNLGFEITLQKISK